MMKSVIFACVLFFFAVHAEKVVVDELEGSSEPQCYHGGHTRLRDVFHIVPCDFEKGRACQTSIFHVDGSSEHQVSKRCVDADKCLADSFDNEPKCTTPENGSHECHYCCTTSLCNESVPDSYHDKEVATDNIENEEESESLIA